MKTKISSKFTYTDACIDSVLDLADAYISMNITVDIVSNISEIPRLSAPKSLRFNRSLLLMW